MYKYRNEQDGGAVNQYPVDDENTMWVVSGKPISELKELAANKWPDVDFDDISIDAVHHHQYSIHYDMHDSSDYVDYLVLSV